MPPTDHQVGGGLEEPSYYTGPPNNGRGVGAAADSETGCSIAVWGGVRVRDTHKHTHTHTRWEPRHKNEARKAVERKLLRNSRVVLDTHTHTHTHKMCQMRKGM